LTDTAADTPEISSLTGRWSEKTGGKLHPEMKIHLLMLFHAIIQSSQLQLSNQTCHKYDDITRHARTLSNAVWRYDVISGVQLQWQR